MNLILETEMWMREFAGELHAVRKGKEPGCHLQKKKIDYLKTLMTRAPL